MKKIKLWMVILILALTVIGGYFLALMYFDAKYDRTGDCYFIDDTPQGQPRQYSTAKEVCP